MKIPTLFGRTPRHQKFTFEPRFYDSKKEEREERNKRILKELGKENGSTEGYQSRIKGSFHSARKRSSASSSDLQASLLRIVILFFLVAFIVAYLQWGNMALYGFLVFIPFYAWIKFRK